jgi:hypothetical protein
MTDTIKLYNKGKSTVYGKGYTFGPDTALAFTHEEGTKLKRLYPGVLIDMGDVQKQFDAATVPAADAAAAPAAASASSESDEVGASPKISLDESGLAAPAEKSIIAKLLNR